MYALKDNSIQEVPGDEVDPSSVPRWQTPERRAYMAAYYARNRAALSAKARDRYDRYNSGDRAAVVERSRRWKQAHPEVVRESAHKRYRENREHRLAISSAGKKRLRQENPEKYREKGRTYAAMRYREDPAFRLRRVMRSRVYVALRRQNNVKKSKRSLELLGCDIAEFLKYIESLWLPGMTWENYGKGAASWEVDHIVACSKFDLSVPVQQHACFHYSNQQPLWGVDNRRKSNR